MSNRLTVVVTCLAYGVLLLDVTPTFSQSARPRVGGAAPGSSRESRPQVEPLRLPNLPEVPDEILHDWSARTQGVRKLQGDVRRITYDAVFKTEKHAIGKFYYEQPDKGRIDLEPAKFAEGTKAGKPGFKLARERAEEWICDGRKIFAIDRNDPKQKTANVVPIPPEARGRNIMNGPLPFLFGMPPKEARERYWLFLKSNNADKCQIVAFPKRQQDRANYKSARVILLKKTYLPEAVLLEGPAGNSQTVYTFKDVAANRPRFPFQGDPFIPNLKGVNVVQPVMPNPVARGKAIPNLIGLNRKDAMTILAKLELRAKVQQGPGAADAQLVGRVQAQSPRAGQPFEKGQVITLVEWSPVVVADNPRPANNPSALRMPDLVGKPGQAAKKSLEALKLVPKFYRGSPATAADRVFEVYKQEPAPGTRVAAGEVVKLTLYTKP